MESELKVSLERRCSTCTFGAYDEDQEPCATCYEDEGTLYGQWESDPDYVMNLVIGTVPTDRVEYSIQILRYMYEFYKLGNPYKHDYDSYDLHEYLKSIPQLPDMDFDKLLVPVSYNFSCRPIYQDLKEINKELNIFKKYVIDSVKQYRRKSHVSILYGEIRNSNGKDRTSVSINVIKNAFIVADAKAKDPKITNIKIAELINKQVHTPEQMKKIANTDIYTYKKIAEILIGRVKNGTFPYDENHEWKLPLE